jgi:hypothetical protein
LRTSAGYVQDVPTGDSKSVAAQGALELIYTDLTHGPLPRIPKRITKSGIKHDQDFPYG